MKNLCQSAWLLALCVICMLSACREKVNTTKVSASVSSYVYAYTSGVISKTAPIKIRFTRSVINQEQVGQPADSKLFKLNPSVEGQLIWSDEQTLVFTPSDNLKSNQEYIGQLKLGNLFDDVPSDAKSFAFDFRTREQHLQLTTKGFQSAKADDLKIQLFNGTLHTADAASAEEVEKTLTAKQGGQSLPISWSHSGDGMQHDFTVENIQRKEDDGTLVLTTNGSGMAVKLNEEKEVTIPGLNNFKVMNAEVMQETEQYLLLHFSDPLLATQNFNGLIEVNGYKGKLRYVVDGNQLRIYPAGRITGNKKINVSTGIRNILNKKMKNPATWSLTFEERNPELKLAGRGVILPNSDGLIFPFEAINLTAIDVEVFQIFDNNILQFLQTNQINGNWEMERVGRVIMQKKVELQNLNPGANATEWSRYALDLSEFFQQDPNAIYSIRIGFRQDYTNYYCGESDEDDNLETNTDIFSVDGETRSIMEYGYYGNNGRIYRGSYPGYNWEQRNDPCYPAYFRSDRFIQRNVIASNLGIIAKEAKDGSMFVAVSDLRTTDPISNTSLTFYDYQQQSIATATTDGDGIARVSNFGNIRPYIVVASNGGQKGYLRLDDGSSLSLSRFDIAGVTVQKGLKGYIYGDRGVWRPGDSLYLQFVLEDQNNKLPSNHPISFEIYDPRNQVFIQQTTSENVNRVYPLHFATALDAPTGNWRAVVKVGGATFRKTLKIETVKPNRLKIKMDLGEEAIAASEMPKDVDLQVNWLHGAPARNLKARVEVNLKSSATSFPKYSQFRFTDPARRFYGSTKTIFNKKVDDRGKAKLRLDLVQNKNKMPGKVRASFRVRAFEEGGDFSEDNFSVKVDPFVAYAGVNIPRNRYGSKRINMDKDESIGFVLVDKDGEPIANRKLTVGLYRVEWRWWWDSNNNNYSRFNSTKHNNSEKQGAITTNDRGEASWTVNVDDWGRYMVRVCDEQSGHCSGDFFYAGYPWYDDDQDHLREGASMLVFNADKEKYQVGETVELRVPTMEGGKVLVSIESGSKVIESYWKPTNGEETKFSFYATKEMAPTVYAHVTYIQPHAQAKNDLPIRMYGVIPITVEDPETILEPTLRMADVLKPEEKVNIEVAERSGKPMAYTIAVVDEGLLDLTRFKTPDPHKAFYAREALGVKTWDVYNHVLGVQAGQMDRLLSIGGDDAVGPGDADQSANRFKPVVKHFGPFYLEKGKTAKHEFIMPNYVGSVRTMVVACDNGVYGKTDKTTPVRKPLMVLATLPRVLGPGESLRLPVNVFAMEDRVKDVRLTLEESTGLVEVVGSPQRQLSFSSPGDELVTFNLKVTERIGVAKFKVIANGGGERATQEIEIDIRNPNPYITDVLATVIQPGSDWTKDYQMPGVAGTNSAILEVSSIPPINFQRRLSWLIRYPHGCIEQTTSAAFPQLYAGSLLELNDKDKQKTKRNIEAAINRLRRFQTAAGGFGYWPGSRTASYWGTSYAGHFMLEAKALGYSLPPNLLERWKDYQSKIAKRWNKDLEDGGYGRKGNELDQVYRLYTLALAGAPELGVMNRMREDDKLSQLSKWRLAAAYAIAGKPEVAKQLVNNLETTVDTYNEISYTYGSDLRDEAMILETLVLMKENTKAAILAKTISEKLSRDRWYSTHTLSYGLLAVGKFVGENTVDGELKYAYQVSGKQLIDAGSNKPIDTKELPIDQPSQQNVTVKNNSQGVLYARIVTSGQPLVGDQSEAENDLQMTVKYKTLDGKSLDVSRIEQGTDFVAEVQITNPGNRYSWYRDMTLNQVFPSGWEIMNTRMSNAQQFKQTSPVDYQDVRDDRVYTYFGVYRNKTRTYRVQLNAAYQGRFYLPSQECEAMYDNTINARKAGQWVEVVAADES